MNWVTFGVFGWVAGRSSDGRERGGALGQTLSLHARRGPGRQNQAMQVTVDVECGVLGKRWKGYRVCRFEGRESRGLEE